VSDVTVPAPQLNALSAGTMMTSQEAMVHGLVGAQYGDLEFDVGKSVRWTQWFVDDIFITDVNLGTPRYWIVNWTETFPEANHTVTGVNWFSVPKDFRKQQFADASKHPALLLEPEDWVIFVDAHEGLCIDTRDPQPDDAAIEPFRSYLYREIARANATGKDRVVLPYYAFLRHDNVIVADYPSPAFEDGSLGFTTAQGSLGTPYYIPYQGLTRLIKVSVLQDPSFDWGVLDTVAPWEIKAGTGTPRYEGYLDPMTGTVSTPDTADLTITADTFISWRVRPLSLGSLTLDQNIGGHWGTGAGQNSWYLSDRGTQGGLIFGGSLDGTNQTIFNNLCNRAALIANFPDGVDVYIGLRIQPNYSATQSRIAVSRSTDGISWTEVGTPALVTKFQALWDATGTLKIGTRGGAGTTDRFTGHIYSGEQRAINRTRLVFPGVSGNYFTAPNAASVTVSGDMEVVARWSRVDLATNYATILRKDPWTLFIDPFGRIQFNGAVGGTTFASPSSTIAFTNNTVYWVKVTRTAATGALAFFWAADAPAEPTSWTAAGTGTSPAGPMDTNNATVEIGSSFGTQNMLNGRILRDVLRNGIGITTPQFIFPGASGNYMTLPSATGLNVTDDFEVVMRLQPTNWSSTALSRPFARYSSGTNNQCFAIQLNGRYLGVLLVPAGAGFVSLQATTSVPYTANERAWIKLTRRSSDGRLQFFYAADAATEPSSWTQIGTDVTGPVGPLNATTAPLMIGGYWTTGDNPFNGRILRAILRNGIGGTVVADVNESNAALGGLTSFTATTGGTVTVTQSTRFMFPGTNGNYMSVPDAAPLDVAGDIEIVVRASLTDWTPASVGNCLIAKDSGSAGGRSWYLRILSPTGQPQLAFSPDATTTPAGYAGTAPPFVDGQPYWLKVTRNATTGLISFFYAADSPTEPTSWTATGTISSPAGAIGAGTANINIGARLNGALELTSGRIYRAIVRNGIAGTVVLDVNEAQAPTPGQTSFAASGGTVTVNQSGSTIVQADYSQPIVRGTVFNMGENDAGTMIDATHFLAQSGQTVTVLQTAGNTIVQPQPDTTVWRFDGNDYTSGLSYTDPRGRTWTLTAAGAVVPMQPAIPAAPVVNTSIVSYGYAHWNLQDIVPPATTVEPLSEANDDGWRMRNLLSMIRPVPALPYGTPYQTPAQDPPGTPGPWAPSDPVTPDPIQPQPVTPDPSLAHLLVGLYDNVLRLNMRDGVYYVGDENGTGLGNIPLKWDPNKNTWVPSSISTTEWHDTEEWVAPVP
jgi:hypothetical protein